MDSKEVFIKRVLALLLIVGIGLVFRFIFSKVDMGNNSQNPDEDGKLVFAQDLMEYKTPLKRL